MYYNVLQKNGGGIIYRDCYFEYAGQQSNKYNLILAYVDSMADSFDSGGMYDVTTDTLPRTAEQLLYGLNYSENPLNFEIEIITPDDKAIPPEQVMEVKNWLFGQDGWKKFRTIDNYQDYYLKCLLIPSEDIVDVHGVRGFRCTLQNASPFWYKDHVFIPDSVTKFTIDVDNTAVSTEKIFPVIKVYTRDNVRNTTVAALANKSNSSYVGIEQVGTDLTYCEIYCKWATNSISSSYTITYNISETYPYFFYLTVGENECVNDVTTTEVTGMEFDYTTQHRIGAF